MFRCVEASRFGIMNPIETEQDRTDSAQTRSGSSAPGSPRRVDRAGRVCRSAPCLHEPWEPAGGASHARRACCVRAPTLPSRSPAPCRKAETKKLDSPQPTSKRERRRGWRDAEMIGDGGGGAGAGRSLRRAGTGP